MGLTARSTGLGAVDQGLVIRKETQNDRVVALAGNPNVGKSTVFNELTGLHQHTGNWPGKTVTNAQGRCTHGGRGYILVDLPGTYSLMAHSAEEECARDFLCFGGADAAVVVCDATCLERNLNLVLQTLEITRRVVVCVNLMDEAEKKHLALNLELLSKRLGVPVVGASARAGKGLPELMQRVEDVVSGEEPAHTAVIAYPQDVEGALAVLVPVLEEHVGGQVNARWLALRLLCGDEALADAVRREMGEALSCPAVEGALAVAKAMLQSAGRGEEALRDAVAASVVETAERVCAGVVLAQGGDYRALDRRLDRFFTSRKTGFPVMLLLLAVIFWLTITGANYPSQLLSAALFRVEDWLTQIFTLLNAPDWLHGALVLGVFRVLAWVVAVMLPPMAIFFPLFTLLEDLGYLPRVAFNLDKSFKKCRACGKQALTMCMGFGCNAAGVVGCRIIDSPRERLIAILTNNFVPCNGRLPTLISMLTMFFVGTSAGAGKSALSALLLTGVILVGVCMTFAVSRALSATVLRGVPSSFTLELPPFRRPQIGKVLVRSIFDRTLFVLGRAAAVAAPAGLVIWLLANVTVGDMSLLAHCTAFLDPFARLIGMDGVILMAFVLGFPANEIVIPIAVMAYLATGTITDFSDLAQLHALLVQNGWTWLTAVCMMLFSLMHWPCSTTLITMYRETHSLKWTAAGFLIPTVCGVAICFVVATVARALGLA